MSRIDGFFTEAGVLKAWPSRKRREDQLLALARLCEAFETDRNYTEKEVNAILKSQIAFEDYVLIRRELIDTGMMQRTWDCRSYWRPLNPQSKTHSPN